MFVDLFFHTQEKRISHLKAPLICTKSNAWLGDGYYFWYAKEDAHLWGKNSKKKTGFYQLYNAKIKNEGILDTVFNEEHYHFWVKVIEKVAEEIFKKTKIRPTIKEINCYFKERAIWNDVNGILFQDIPGNEDYVSVQKFFYKKRIQLAIYNLKNIESFNFESEHSC